MYDENFGLEQIEVKRHAAKLETGGYGIKNLRLKIRPKQGHQYFPSIDEKRFSVLYSDKASRPNEPINVIIGH